MKNKLSIVYILIVLLSSCEQPVEYRETIKEVEVIKEVPVEVIVEKEVPVTTETIKEVPVTVEVETVKEIEVIKEVPMPVTVIKEVPVPVTVEVETIKEVEKIVYVDKIIDNVILIREIVEKEVSMETASDVKEVIIPSPILEYTNYVSLGAGLGFRAFGVNADGLIELDGIRKLSKVEGVLYFEYKGNSFKQVGQDVTQIEELPVIDSPRIEFEKDNFKVTIGEYKGDTFSYVFNRTLQVAFKNVTGACMRGNDLLVSVGETIATRYKGVYIWTVNDTAPRLIFEEGIIF